MNIPNFLNINIAQQDGSFSDEWNLNFQQLFQELQNNFGATGCVVPSMETSNINQLQNVVNGTLIYDSTIDELKLRQGGVFKIVQTV